MTRKGFAIIISAPSGAGKTTLCRMLLEKDSSLQYSVSATTRAPRSAEKNGEDYHFVSRETFQSMVERNDFAEWAEYQGEYYGTPRPWLKKAFSRGDTVVMDMDVQGVKQIREGMGQDVVCVMIYPPSWETLRKRLSRRNTESEERLQGRLNRALSEVQSYGLFDYLVLNEDLQIATDTLYSIVVAERHRRSRQEALFARAMAGSI